MLDEPHRQPIRLGPLADYAGYHLRLAQSASFQAFAARVGRGDLRPGLFTLLTLIRENPGITQTAISQASGRDKSTLTPALRSLEERGYIDRERVDRDRRSFRLSLTPAGEEAAAQLSEAARAHDAELDRIIGAENKAEFIRILRNIVASLAQAREADATGR
jgi:DNA-binding MarR family transcriptional regulator